MFSDFHSYRQAAEKKYYLDSSLGHMFDKPTYSCCKVSYKEFNAEYRSKNVVYRKILAIPRAFYHGILKTVYHLVSAIILGIGELFKKDRKHFKLNIFVASRDLEAGLGHFITLFKERLGAYFVQESNFNIFFYQYFTKKYASSSKKTVFLSHSNNAQILAAANADKDKPQLLKEQRINSSPCEQGELNKSVKKTKYEIMSENELNTLTIEQVKDITYEEARMIAQRFETLSEKSTSIPKLAKSEDVFKLSIHQFRLLSEKELERLGYENISINLLPLFFHQKKIDRILLENENLSNLFKTYKSLDQERQKIFIEIMNLSNGVTAIFHSGKFFVQWLQACSEKLDEIPAYDLIFDQFPISRLRFMLMKDDELLALSLKEIAGINDEVDAYLDKRLSGIPRPSAQALTQNSISTMKNCELESMSMYSIFGIDAKTRKSIRERLLTSKCFQAIQTRLFYNEMVRAIKRNRDENNDVIKEISNSIKILKLLIDNMQNRSASESNKKEVPLAE